MSRTQAEKRYLRTVGALGFIPQGPVRRRLRHLHDTLGIPLILIAQRAGLDGETVKRHRRGYYVEDGVRHEQKFCCADTYRAIMGAKFTSADVSRFPSVGIRRRLQALQVAGFNLALIAGMTGIDYREVHRVMAGKGSRGYVHPDRARAYIAVYEKLENARPEDFGVSVSTQGQCRTRGRKNGYAPPHCWDPDTIDDPEAVPEWTGACGTPEGLRIHYRDKIPTCAPCLATREQARREAGSCKSGFSGSKLRRAREARGMSIAQLGEHLGVHEGTVYYWETGRSAPRAQERVSQLCAILGVPESELTEEDA
ncbi:MAG TPA: helix-turn-helix transcriptional regulator [Acidimicrobiia bacterium]|nr:helix-turn-helix transcriptional regulator [Acidimicrobiia bacterium]